MSDVAAIGDEKEDIFVPPDPLWRADLWHHPTNPDFDTIAEQQRDADNGREDLFLVSIAPIH
jgi:hypothetical protein